MLAACRRRLLVMRTEAADDVGQRVLKRALSTSRPFAAGYRVARWLRQTHIQVRFRGQVLNPSMV
jgi:hypothetical protein